MILASSTAGAMAQRDGARRWGLRSLVPILEKGMEVVIGYDEYPFGVLDMEDRGTSALLLAWTKMKRGFRERYGYGCSCEAVEMGLETDKEERGVGVLMRRVLDRAMREVTVEKVKNDMDIFVVKFKQLRLPKLVRYAHERSIELYMAAENEFDKITDHVLKLYNVRRRLFGARDEKIVVLIRGFSDSK